MALESLTPRPPEESYPQHGLVAPETSDIGGSARGLNGAIPENLEYDGVIAQGSDDSLEDRDDNLTDMKVISAATSERAEKNAQIRELVESGFEGETPDVIFSFSGSIIKDGERDRYRTLAYSDLSEHGLVTGGRSRVIATAEIAKAIPDVPIVVNSFNRFDPEEPTMASVVKRELISRGTDPTRIVDEERSFSTITQLIEMVDLAVSNGWTKVAIVANTWYFPRLREMYNRLGEIVSYEAPVQNEQFHKLLDRYRKLGVRAEFISSENVMRIASGHYDTYLNAAEQTPAFQKTLEAEARGLADLRAGRYRVVLQPEKPRNN